MAIVRENLTINSKRYVRTYSDSNHYIERNGVQYSEAIDPIEYKNERIYTETDEPIDGEEEFKNSVPLVQ